MSMSMSMSMFCDLVVTKLNIVLECDVHLNPLSSQTSIEIAQHARGVCVARGRGSQICSDQNAPYHAAVVRLREREVTGERELEPARLLVRGVGQLRVPQAVQVVIGHLEHLDAAHA